MSPEKPKPFSDRTSGVLLHPTSLPGQFGIGDLGPNAFAFADFLSSAGQTWWQMLPVGPPGAGHSPYDSPSAFAGSPLLISLEVLQQDGLLAKAAVTSSKKLADAKRTAYVTAQRVKSAKLRAAYEAFKSDATAQQKTDLEAFSQSASHWLDSYSLFAALKQHNAKKAWFQWDPALSARNGKAIRKAMKALSDDVAYYRFEQYLFEQQWQALKAHCHTRSVRLLGDIPMFVAHDAADVWENQNLFFVDELGRRTFVAGVPPDYFSEDGQLWGNPLYRWDVLRDNDYAWWIARLKHTLTRFDALRLDHFIAFHRYWEIPGEATSAKTGRFVKVPGKHFFRRVRKKLGSLPFVAEDLGLVTPKVHELRELFGLPGMRVLQFGFSDGAEMYLPHRYTKNSVVYTGTHDNDTLVGWLAAKGGNQEQATAMRKERERARAYVAGSRKNLHWDMIRVLQMSTANTALFPMQDLLGLGSDARMNIPGTPSGNWGWRLQPGLLTAELAGTLRSMAELYERLPSPTP
jgi:4-alpha-glucanotransferase